MALHTCSQPVHVAENGMQQRIDHPGLPRSYVRAIHADEHTLLRKWSVCRLSATAISAAADLAGSIERGGERATIVMLTDGRANITRDGEPGRGQAEAEALTAARRLSSAGLAILLVDTSPQPHAMAERIAAAMGAQYFPLPYGDARGLAQAVRASFPAPGNDRTRR